MELRDQSFDIEDDLRYILLDTRDRGKLVQHAVDFDGRHRMSRQRGKQHTAQAVAQRDAKAALQRLHNKLAVGSVGGKVQCFDFGFLDLYHFANLL